MSPRTAQVFVHGEPAILVDEAASVVNDALRVVPSNDDGRYAIAAAEARKAADELNTLAADLESTERIRRCLRAVELERALFRAMCGPRAVR